MLHRATWWRCLKLLALGLCICSMEARCSVRSLDCVLKKAVCSRRLCLASGFHIMCSCQAPVLLCCQATQQHQACLLSVQHSSKGVQQPYSNRFSLPGLAVPGNPLPHCRAYPSCWRPPSCCSP